MYALEAKRIKAKEPDKAVEMAAVMQQAEEAEAKAAAEHAEAAKVAQEEKAAAEIEAARLQAEAEKAEGEAKAKADFEAIEAAEVAAEALRVEEEQRASAMKAQQASRRASVSITAIHKAMTAANGNEGQGVTSLAAYSTNNEEGSVVSASMEVVQMEEPTVNAAVPDEVPSETAKVAAKANEGGKEASSPPDIPVTPAAKAEEEGQSLPLSLPPIPLSNYAGDVEEEFTAASIEEQSEAVMKDWVQIAEEQEAAARAKAEAEVEAEFAALDHVDHAVDHTLEIEDLDDVEEDEAEETAYENANADANAGLAYVDPSTTLTGDVGDAEADEAAAAAMQKMGVLEAEQKVPTTGESTRQPHYQNAVPSHSSSEMMLSSSVPNTVAGASSGDGISDKLKGYVRPRKSIFMKWQQNSEQLYSKKKVKKDQYIPKVMKTRDSKSWMVQL